MPALIVIVVLLGLMWLLLIRPQRRKQAEQQQMLSNVQIGDEIITAGGIYGEIVALDDSEVTLEIASNTRVRLARRAIAGIMTEEEEEEPEELEAEPDELEAEPDELEAEPEEEAGLDSSVAERHG